MNPSDFTPAATTGAAAGVPRDHSTPRSAPALGPPGSLCISASCPGLCDLVILQDHSSLLRHPNSLQVKVLPAEPGPPA